MFIGLFQCIAKPQTQPYGDSTAILQILLFLQSPCAPYIGASTMYTVHKINKQCSSYFTEHKKRSKTVLVVLELLSSSNLKILMRQELIIAAISAHCNIQKMSDFFILTLTTLSSNPYFSIILCALLCTLRLQQTIVCLTILAKYNGFHSFSKTHSCLFVDVIKARKLVS